MDIKELKDFLAGACETARSKYIPWWEDDFEYCIYRYDIFTDKEIKDVEECVMKNAKDWTANPVALDSTGFPLFHMLVWCNFYDIILKLLEDKDLDIDINLGGGGKNITPLMLACCRGNYNMAKLLLGYGALAGIQDADGRNVYHYLALPHIGGLANVYECVKNSILQRKDIVKLLSKHNTLQDENRECMLEDGIRQKDKDGLDPLAFMLNGNNTNCSWALTDIFIEKGADICYIDAGGNTLLMAAIKNHHMTAALKLAEVAKYLNQKGRDAYSIAPGVEGIINRSNNEGKTPLQLAKDSYNEVLCMALKDYGATDSGGTECINTEPVDWNELSRITSNAFACCSQDERDKISIAIYLAKKLVKLVDMDDDDGINCILSVFYNALTSDEDCQILDICREAGMDFTAPVFSGSGVCCARDKCLGGNYGVKAVKKLQSFGVDMDKPVIKGRTPALIVASLQKRNMPGGRRDDYFENAARLFSKKSMEQADDEGTTAMHWAARNNHQAMLKVMIEKGADVNITEDHPSEAGNTPLHTACIYGSAEALKILEEYGADDSLQNINGETPAHLAVMKKKSGGDLTARERLGVLTQLKNLGTARNDGKTPLMLLQYLDINTTMDLLPVFLNKGAGVNHADNTGNTALILNAKHQCYKKVMKELVNAGADINATDNKGNNALYYALRYGSQECASFLLKKGADYQNVNNQGITPLQVAVEHGYAGLLPLMDN